MIPIIREQPKEEKGVVKFFLEKGEREGLIYLMAEEGHIEWVILKIDSNGIYPCTDIGSNVIPTDEEGRIKIKRWK
jgi:hypothetical protein